MEGLWIQETVCVAVLEASVDLTVKVSAFYGVYAEYICTAPVSVVPAMSSSYNPLPRASGKIQYEAETKPRSSNCILPEALRSGL